MTKCSVAFRLLRDCSWHFDYFGIARHGVRNGSLILGADSHHHDVLESYEELWLTEQSVKVEKSNCRLGGLVGILY